MLGRKGYRSATWSRSFRVKHRRAWLVIVSSAIVLSMVAVILLTAILVTQRDLPYQVSLSTAGQSNARLITSGINLSNMPSANLIRNASFEKQSMQAAVNVLDGIVSEEQQVVETSLLNEDWSHSIGSVIRDMNYRLMRQNGDGTLVEMDHGEITSGEINVPLYKQAEKLGHLAANDNYRPVTYDIYMEEDGGEQRFVLVDAYGSIIWYNGSTLEYYHLDGRSGELLDGLNEAGLSNDRYGLTDIERAGDWYYAIRKDGAIFRTSIDDPRGWARVSDIVVRSEINIDSESIAPNGKLSIPYEEELGAVLAVGDVLMVITHFGDVYQIKGDEVRISSFEIYALERGFNKTSMLPFQSGIVNSAAVMGDALICLTSYFGLVFDLEVDGDGFVRFTGHQDFSLLHADFAVSIAPGYVYEIAVVDEDYAILYTYAGPQVFIERVRKSDGTSEIKIQIDNVEDWNSSHLRNITMVYEMIPISRDQWYFIYTDGGIELVSRDGVASHYSTSGYLPESILGSDFTGYFDYRFFSITDHDGFVFTDETMNLYQIPYGMMFSLESLQDGPMSLPLDESSSALVGDILILQQALLLEDRLNHIEELYSSIALPIQDKEDKWSSLSGTTILAYETARTRAGDHYMRLSDQSTLSQKLAAANQAEEMLIPRALYSVSFDASPVNSSGSGTLTVEITGPFSPIQLWFTNFSSGWKRYEMNFIVPKHSNSSENIEIHFTWAGEDSLDIDNLLLTESLRGDHVFDEAAVGQLNDASPSVIRFSDARFGQEAWASSHWLDYGMVNLHPNYNGTDINHSLEAALRLAKSSKSQPWLVFDSFSSKKDAKEFLNYMAANINDQWGQYRLNNGTAVPWTNHFSQVFIEVTDSYGVYRSDRERAAFVDYILEGLAESPYYNNVKQQLVLIDSMDYQEGLMLSSADYHASDLSIESQQYESIDLAISESYVDFHTATPRRLYQAGSNSDEFISIFDMDFDIMNGDELGTITLADYLWAALYKTDESAATLMMDYDLLTGDPAYLEIVETVSGILSSFANSDRRNAIVTIGETQDDGRDYQNIYTAALEHEGRLILFLMNRGEQAKTLQLNIGLGRHAGTVEVYDSHGQHLRTQAYPGDHRRLMIPPGAVSVVIENRP